MSSYLCVYLSTSHIQVNIVGSELNNEEEQVSRFLTENNVECNGHHVYITKHENVEEILWMVLSFRRVEVARFSLFNHIEKVQLTIEHLAKLNHPNIVFNEY
jgi:malate synthase